MDSIIREIRSNVEAIESDADLYEQTNFGARAKALDRLEFDVAERIEELLLTNGGSEALAGLRQYAEAVRGRLERVDEGLFQTLRQRIASGDYTGSWLRQQIVTYAGGDRSAEGGRNEGYDSLDALVHGLLLAEPAPEEVGQREPEMVPYQPTPARIVLEMVDKTDFRPDDVFYDVGSGLGQVAILVHLLSGVRTRGLEVEPAYCHYATRCARALNLSRVEFINVDAREAGYSDGTIFFLYTPFEGGMLDQVLGRLRDESRKRSVRLYTYGPCTLVVSQQVWLERVDHNGNRVDRLATFKTRAVTLRAK